MSVSHRRRSGAGGRGRTGRALTHRAPRTGRAGSAGTRAGALIHTDTCGFARRRCPARAWHRCTTRFWGADDALRARWVQTPCGRQAPRSHFGLSPPVAPIKRSWSLLLRQQWSHFRFTP
ncbi:hypothetical protein NDU88_001530 [Pleurodeles waltl]|uniref:Uncharacterized protein n=1 Tax=Pleurodeles waltl TaxID=8319 RepID=A0AAV7RA80_PLEWA|nr:hypothetical protein NDU88_001530 [Pleurodeles waltl]